MFKILLFSILALLSADSYAAANVSISWDRVENATGYIVYYSVNNAGFSSVDVLESPYDISLPLFDEGTIDAYITSTAGEYESGPSEVVRGSYYPEIVVPITLSAPLTVTLTITKGN